MTRWLPRGLKNLLRPSFYAVLDALHVSHRRVFPSPLANEEYNRVYWDRYARTWDPTQVPVEDESITASNRAERLHTLGNEWGRAPDVDAIVAEFVDPFLTNRSTVAEIGSGAGRFASRVAGKVARLHCFDISAEMLAKARRTLAAHSNVEFHLLQESQLPSRFEAHFDFVYSFDVFVHLDLHTMWKYFTEIHRVLKDGGRTFLHTTNLRAPAGWANFSHQTRYTVEGHYFISPEIVAILAERAGFRQLRESRIDARNFYLNRDYLVVLEK